MGGTVHLLVGGGVRCVGPRRATAAQNRRQLCHTVIERSFQSGVPRKSGKIGIDTIAHKSLGNLCMIALGPWG